MPVVRSRTGCLTCRARKLKCDEQKPQCSQCRKASRECRPSEGIVFRHQQNASMNKAGGAAGLGANAENERGSLRSFYSYKNTFDEDSVWLEIPKQVTFVDNSDPYVEELEASMASLPNTPISNHRTPTWNSNNNTHYRHSSLDVHTHGLEALSAAATRDPYPLPPQVSGAIDPAMGRNNAFNQHEISPSLTSPNHGRNNMPPPSSPVGSISSSNNNIHFLLNPSTSISPIDPNLHPTTAEQRESPYTPSTLASRGLASDFRTDVNVESEYEIAFLLRHFSESPGQWMDLFDLGTYFASYVPVRAATNPLLKYAACAYAAKQLGRVKGNKALVGGVCSRQASMEVWPGANKADWYYYAAKYYEKAIQLLMESLQHDGKGPPPLSTPEAFGQWQAAELCDDSEYPHKRRRRCSNNRLSSDEVLAATAILSVYEFLDATGPAWNRHLSGVKSLLDIAEVGMMPVEQRGAPFPQPKRPGLSKARRATFWNFARQDYLAAFINECQSRLNTDDLDLWTEAGLLLDDMGFVRPSNTTETGYPEGEDIMKEDLISNALIWLLSKVVNFIAAGGDLPHDAASMGASQQTPLERWHQLQAELDAWHSGLPDSFKPCARIEPPRRASQHPNGDIYPFPEAWYSVPMCGSTMQHYHMARILLLINKPHESTSRRGSITNRLKSYRSIENEIRYHSYEIIAISMSRPEASVRIHSIQPLFVSGQCLTEPRERRVILQLLRGIEDDLGWASEYRVNQLLKEWEWDEQADIVSGS
ncbi:hypothetical protein AJ80_04259 [Polytolypa hystricis UAMH7299]|uniref:Zn(2)-C6 fungal-type domain-containing protein n=1 Tax=Polytolypa hystricis (strain UAMH7299) TaxID=1447883 RepID=A0A2B7YDI4_POLH7|nr:hypothetical protein AJ80_04259 [Polytolypa hystricis UAMH7299]